MPNIWQIIALLFIPFLAFFVALAIDGPPDSVLDVLRLLSAPVTATSVSLLLFHLWLWRWMPRAIARRPDLNGTWRVRGTPWSEHGNELQSFTGFVFVRQRYFSMSMRLETEETTSELVAQQFTLSPGGLFHFWAVYHCEPQAGRAPSSITCHYGAFHLTCPKVLSDCSLEGRYWIDGEVMDTKGRLARGGRLVLNDHRRENYHDLQVAMKAYSE